MEWYELAKLFLFSLWVTMGVAAAGAMCDVILIKRNWKAWLRPKWLWNLTEIAVIIGLISWKMGFPLPWWHMTVLYATMTIFWSALHDCWIGAGIANDWWHLGKGKWDSFIFPIFNQFGLPAGLVYLLVKLFWAGLATAAFFSL